MHIEAQVLKLKQRVHIKPDVEIVTVMHIKAGTEVVTEMRIKVCTEVAA